MFKDIEIKNFTGIQTLKKQDLVEEISTEL